MTERETTTGTGNGQVPPPPEPLAPEIDVTEFWSERDILRHILTFARARRVSPWALFAVLLIRTAARIPSNVVLPKIIGGRVSLNTYAAIVSPSGGGKGSAENAGHDCLDIEPVPAYGPGSGEGIGHLFAGYDSKAGKVVPHTPSVILSAQEVDTLGALRGRQASTLLAELRKAWMGEPLGFGYVDKTKRLQLERHRYRLGLLVGVQPLRAGWLLEDAGSGTPQRFLWLPGQDPDIAPDDPDPYAWRNPFQEPGVSSNYGWLLNAMHDDAPLQDFGVCETVWDEIDQGRLPQLRGDAVDELDSQALLCQEKVAAILAVWDGRTAIVEEDWWLAGTVRAVSDATRQGVADTLEREKAQRNRARGRAEAEREVIKHSALAEQAVQRVARALLRKLKRDGGWVVQNRLKRVLATEDRKHFDDAIDSLIASGQVDARATPADHRGHQGTEYRRHP